MGRSSRAALIDEEDEPAIARTLGTPRTISESVEMRILCVWR